MPEDAAMDRLPSELARAVDALDEIAVALSRIAKCLEENSGMAEEED